MEVRRKPHDHEVVLSASTADRKLGVAPFPNFGFLLLFIPIEEMKTRISGDYVADVIAVDDVYTRKIIQMELTILEGITR
jgi:hypothetical protein